jgi:flagellar protein FlaG
MTTDSVTLNNVTNSKVNSPQLPTSTQNSDNQSSKASVSASPAPAQTENIIRLEVKSRQTAAAEANLQSDQEPTISDTVSTLNQSTQVVSRDLEFSVDEASGRTVITVKDSKTDEVIRQIPSEQLLKIAARLQELQESRQEDRSASGILFTSQT